MKRRDLDKDDATKDDVEGRNEEEVRRIASLRRHGQGHLLRFWGELKDEERDVLMSDVERIDLDWVEEVKNLLHEESLDTRTVHKPDIIGLPRTPEQREAAATAAERGSALIEGGKTAVFTAAGGQSSRLGLETPKGTYPVTPVKKKSLFQVHAEKILHLQRTCHVQIPWIIMTSETNHQQTMDFFRDNRYFGLPPDSLRFIEQGMFPALANDGRMFLREKHRVFLSPTGHGGTFQTLHDSGALQWLKELGIEQLYYFQVDNVLINILDPLFLGYHAEKGCEMSSKCIMKRGAGEKLGVFVIEGGAPTVVEYSELSSVQLEDGSPTSDLVAGSPAMHIIAVDFALERIGKSVALPLHVAHKAIPHIDESGSKVTPDRPNGYKIETFIFDALKYVSNSVILEVARGEEFSPLKNRSGDDSPETVLRDQLRFFASWFEDAGLKVPRDSDGEPAHKLEVSPLFALSREEFRKKIDRDLVIEGDAYIE
jgi:UDP-N-acetylglucosamine/UDP-N-acetylgalactosamine diphosphorylase